MIVGQARCMWSQQGRLLTAIADDEIDHVRHRSAQANRLLGIDLTNDPLDCRRIAERIAVAARGSGPRGSPLPTGSGPTAIAWPI